MPVVRRTLIASLLATVVLVTGCGSDDPGTTGAAETATSSAPGTSVSPPSTTAPPSAIPAPPATGTVITTGDSEFGVMLFDGSRQALYLFDREQSGVPDCYDECAAAWPPVLTDGAPQAGGDADPGLLGSTPRRDGTMQVTYAGHPLYAYANEGPGEVLCHDVFLNGGTWYVVTPEGDRGPT